MRHCLTNLSTSSCVTLTVDQMLNGGTHLESVKAVDLASMHLAIKLAKKLIGSSPIVFVDNGLAGA